MSDTTPAPTGRPPQPSRAVNVARALWLLSFVAGLLAVVFAFLSRDVQIDHLRTLVKDLRPEQDAETLKTVASTVFWGCLGAIVLVIAVEALNLRVLMRRHGGARWTLLFLVLVQAAVTVLAIAFLGSPGSEGNAILVLLAAALVLAGAALVACALPGAGAWFRTEHKTRPRGARTSGQV
jgi:drug/metabolite transporter (DMT)-like permease